MLSKNSKKRECVEEPFDVLRCPFLVDTKLPQFSLQKEKTLLAKQTRDNFKGACASGHQNVNPRIVYFS